MNLLYVFEHGDPVLIATFLVLIGMSLISWYIIIWKAWAVRSERRRLKRFRTQYATVADWPLRVTAADARGGVAILLQAVSQHSGQHDAHPDVDRREQQDTYLAQAVDNIRTWLDKGLTILASIGSSAPFIGLFGTVWGIYIALTRIATAGNASLNVVAGPMGEALVATAVGLFAAIPAVLAYNAFGRANRLLIQDIRHLAEQISLYSAVLLNTGKGSDEPVKLVSGSS